MGTGVNPAKGMLGSQLIEKTYIDVFGGGEGEANTLGSAIGSVFNANSSRIPGYLIEQVENQLDAEYVPFYFHDLRTNEIVAFHAFLENLTDRYSPNYTSTSGYGRVDQVKVYRDTRRALSFSFYVAATSKEDFDEMWWKINKLTSLVYPSWTPGDTLQSTGFSGTDSTFKMPFSQVLAASPLIRLRIGDVIKGNYSRFNLARIFGIGSDGIAPRTEAANISAMGAINQATGGTMAATMRKINEVQFETVFNLMFGSPFSLISAIPSNPASSDVNRAAAGLLFGLFGGTFTNPLGVAYVMKKLLSPDVVANAVPGNSTLIGSIEASANRVVGIGQGSEFGYGKADFPFLKASTDEGYLFADGSGKRVRVARPIRVKVLGNLFKGIGKITGERTTEVLSSPSNVSGFDAPFKGEERTADPKYKTYYKVAVSDANTGLGLFGKNRLELVVTHEDLMPNINTMFNTRVLPFLSITAFAEGLLQSLANEAATVTGIPSDVLSGLISTSEAANFMKPENNPITRAFESAGGRGLAGVISNLTYSWIDAQNTWEIDWNSRAPMVAKIDVSFDAIHDIPPGLDHNGYNRAPIYNVGDIMRFVAGDAYPDNGHASKNYYTSAGRYGNVAEDDTSQDTTIGNAKKSFGD